MLIRLENEGCFFPCIVKAFVEISCHVFILSANDRFIKGEIR